MSIEDLSGTTPLVEYAAASTSGPMRGVNEDAFGVFEQSGVFVVVDGCGGGSSPRSAANLTLASFAHAAKSLESKEDPLVAAVLGANVDVFREVQRNSRCGMGSTLCAVRVSARTVSAVHVGACRVGCYDERRLRWLTEDDTLAVALRRRGAPPDEIDRHANVITRAVGVSEHLVVDVTHYPAISGRIYLLCTDGLTRQVDDARISDLVGAPSLDLRERCIALLEAAETAGGHDNATVMLIRLRSDA